MDDVRSLSAAPGLALPAPSRLGTGAKEAISDFLVPPLLLAALGLLALNGNYLLFHTLAELGSVLIAVMAMVVARVSLTFTRNHFSVFIAVGFGWCALLDTLHALGYPGLGLLPLTEEAGTQLWVASRLIQAGVLLFAPLWLNGCVNPAILHLGFGSAVLLAALLVLSGNFPLAISESSSGFRFASEYLVSALLLSALMVYWHRRQRMSMRLFNYLLVAVLALMASGLAFSSAQGLHSQAHVLGHLLKVIGYWFIYLALVRQTLCEPFNMLERAASTYDAVPDPTLIIDRAGAIRQANRAAAALVGQPAEALVGQSCHALFHDAGVPPEQCPICAHLKASTQPFSCELTIPARNRDVSCSLAPFIDGGHAFVQVLRDISRRRALEREREKSEQRFQNVFSASPVPMQIFSLEQQRLTAINEAHQRWLGYPLEEIATLEDWFAKVCPGQQLIESRWNLDMALAASGHSVRTPELTLQRKDGTPLIAQGTLTESHGDLILAWTDLTEIRQSEQSLRESEQRFRGMIEQTISGIFVWRAGSFIYVNPRFCQIVGWRANDLLGRPLSLFSSEQQHLEEAFAQLQQGTQRSVALTIALQCHDGRVIEVGLHASQITWDDGEPAVIVMAQDITERKRAEEQIAHYVAQLEGAMKGTLRAVSNMVEMRDPYTAGHERRVGLIARDLGLELGWSEQRCETLELAGLVHDIGKIAIPAEILVKPTRLSPLEMELMRGHAQASYDILRDVPFATPIAEIIHQHHERMDGTGYPQGLAGEQILPEARVLAVADVLESMAAHRPYRPSRGVGAALAELEEGSGTRYDPQVVQAMIRMVCEKGYQLPD